jgi:hypothetical protein
MRLAGLILLVWIIFQASIAGYVCAMIAGVDGELWTKIAEALRP